MISHVVQISGGIGSWATGRLVVDRLMKPDDQLILLFADTLIEDRDTYMFLDAAADDLGVPLTRVADGRTPWQVFKDTRFLGNTRADPCSKILKRDLLRAYIDRHFDPDSTIIYLEIGRAHV